MSNKSQKPNNNRNRTRTTGNNSPHSEIFNALIRSKLNTNINYHSHYIQSQLVMSQPDIQAPATTAAVIVVTNNKMKKILIIRFIFVGILMCT